MSGHAGDGLHYHGHGADRYGHKHVFLHINHKHDDDLPTPAPQGPEVIRYDSLRDHVREHHNGPPSFGSGVSLETIQAIHDRDHADGTAAHRHLAAPQGPEGDVEAIRQRLDAATPGPWRATAFAEVWKSTRTVSPFIVASLSDREDDGRADDNRQADANFIANAPTDIATLLAALSAAVGRRDKMEQLAMDEGERVKALYERAHAAEAALTEEQEAHAETRAKLTIAEADLRLAELGRIDGMSGWNADLDAYESKLAAAEAARDAALAEVERLREAGELLTDAAKEYTVWLGDGAAYDRLNSALAAWDAAATTPEEPE